MEIKSTQTIKKCSKCNQMGFNLNYVVAPTGRLDNPVDHLMLCSVCTAQYVQVFLDKNGHEHE